jgi:hypothetical protein
MVNKTCEVCGKVFQVKPYRAETARFCSFACGGKWHLSVRDMPNEHKYGNQWAAGRRPANAFTSEQAIAMNTVRGTEHACAYCGVTFEIKPWLARQNRTKSGLRFCCKDCHSRYMSETMSGEDSPQWVGGPTTYRGKGWLEARAAAVERDDGTCQACGAVVGPSIPVHHIRPYRLFASPEEANALGNLVCLCQSCHMRAEASE